MVAVVVVVVAVVAVGVGVAVAVAVGVAVVVAVGVVVGVGVVVAVGVVVGVGVAVAVVVVMNLTFDEASHIYRLDNRVVPSVTGVIGACVPNEFEAMGLGEYHKERGHTVHAAVAAALEGKKFKWSFASKLFKPRVDACLKFVRDQKLKPVAVEQKLASERYRFAGTVDLVARNGDARLVVVDWKGTITKTVDVQMGAYTMLYNEDRGDDREDRIEKAVAVECGDDGNYKAVWMNAAALRVAGQTFLAMLTVRNWLEKNNYTKPK